MNTANEYLNAYYAANAADKAYADALQADYGARACEARYYHRAKFSKLVKMAYTEFMRASKAMDIALDAMRADGLTVDDAEITREDLDKWIPE